MYDNHNVGGTTATRSPLLGASLTELLAYTSGDTSVAPPAEDSAKRELYEELKPKYNSDEVRERIEQNCRFNAIKPHLIDASADIPEPVPILSRYGSVIASEGNISAVVGQAKSKKTFLCTALVGALLREGGATSFGIKPSKSLVLWVDTEQSANHVLKVIQRMQRIAGVDPTQPYELLKVLTLREIEPKERFNILRDAIAYYRPRLVVVDGISDLMYNSNCIEESDAVVGEFMTLSTEYKCHIMSVLHTNPNSDKARGHIGSTLQRKVETMIYVRKCGECSVVEPQYCRNEEFAPFAFRVNEEGIPEECEMPNEREEQSAEANSCVRIMQEGYPNGIDRQVMVTKLVEVEGINRAHARVKVSRAIAKGHIYEKGGVLYLP